MNLWRDYFSDLLNPVDATPIQIHEEQVGEDIQITEADVNAVIISLKTGKAPGEDDIRPAMLKAMNMSGVRWLSVGLRQGCSLSPILFLIYMDRIVKNSESCGGVKIGECTVQRLLFADDLVLLDSTQNGLQQALDRFSDACSVAGMKISTTKTETMCLSRQPKQCSLQIDGVPLKQSEKFKYLGVSFTSDGRQNSKLDIRIGKASAVMRQLHRSVVLKRELCTKAKLSIFRSVYVPILTYGHECWIMNEKVRSRVQAAEMGFLRRISGLILLDKVKSADIRESLNIESLLLRLERSQLRWYGHVTRMPQERTAKKLLCSTPIGRRPRGRPRTRWRDYVEDLSWSRLGIPAEHLSFVAEDRDAWRLQLELLPPRPPKDKRVQKID